jgi:hypothetical protein
MSTPQQSEMIRLPAFDGGTDWERGRLLAELLQQPGASEIRKSLAARIDTIDVNKAHLDNADLITVLRLAYDGNYLAAGAVYFLYQSRLMPRWNKHLKVLRAAAAHKKKSDAIIRRKNDLQVYLDTFTGKRSPPQKNWP